MNREPVPPTPRKAMTPARRRAVLEAYDGRCAEPACAKLLGPDWQADHVIPLELGGSDTLDNLQPLCARPCHQIKTAWDVKAIRKAARLRAREDGTRRPRQPIPGRKLDKHPTLKRGFDGKVVSR